MAHKNVPTKTVGDDWAIVSAGYSITAAVNANGEAYLWGENNYGQVGDGTYGTNKDAPTQVMHYPYSQDFVITVSAASTTGGDDDGGDGSGSGDGTSSDDGGWNIWWIPLILIGALLFFILMCREGPKVSGKVTHNGKGVKDVTITYVLHNRAEQSVRTDKNGNYAFNVVKDVDLRITNVTKEGFVLSSRIDPILIVGHETELNMALEEK